MSETYARKTVRKPRRKKYKGKGLNRKEKAQVVKLVKKTVLPMVEKKHHDTQHTINIGAAVQTADLINLVQDDTDTSRNGDQVTLESIFLRYRLSNTTNSVVRIMLVQWKSNTLDDPINWADLVQFSTSTTTDMASPLNIDQSKKFIMLYDKIHYLSSQNPISAAQVYLKKGFTKNISYNEAITSGFNHIYLVVNSDNATTTGFNGVSRVRYYDA